MVDAIRDRADRGVVGEFGEGQSGSVGSWLALMNLVGGVRDPLIKP